MSDLIQYEKVITIRNDEIDARESFAVIQRCVYTLMNFIDAKCRSDAEFLEYFQMTLTDSERQSGANPHMKDLKIKWAVVKNEI